MNFRDCLLYSSYAADNSILELFFKERLKKKKENQEALSHVAHAHCELYISSMVKRKGLPVGTVQYLGRGHRPTPDPVTAKMAFFS